MTETMDAEGRLGAARGAVAELLRKAGVSRDSLWAVGVGTPGIIDGDGSVRLGTAMPGWTGLDLGARLRRSFRCPVLIENDANLAAIAEHWQGAAVGMGDVVFVLAGLSPGAGSLINGGCTAASVARRVRSAPSTCWASRPPRSGCSPPPASRWTRWTRRRWPGC